MADEGLQLVAYQLDPATPLHIAPAAPSRAWINALPKSFATRCLPLLMANQSGWHLLNPEPFRATYLGGELTTAIVIESLREDGAPPRLVHSQFGSGILTWRIPYLFRTRQGYNLLVRGPANMPRDGIAPLEGLVEADWASQTFTMNWKFTRAGASAVFLTGDPFCMVVPQRRGELEAFQPRVAPMAEEPETARRVLAFARSREIEVGMRRVAGRISTPQAAMAFPYERHYFEGMHTTGEPAPEHQQRRALLAFELPPTVTVPDPAHATRERAGPDPAATAELGTSRSS